MTHPTVWFITGATRGLGAAVAKAALAAGNKVAATGRKLERVREALGDSDNLLPLELDVTRDEQIRSAVEKTMEKFGRIDVLVNNAGYGQFGIFEETPMDVIRAQYDTNTFGLMAVTGAIVPAMRKQRGGRIFNISSIAGLKGLAGCSVYCSSKFAVEGFSQGLAEELAPYLVHVTCISPGYFRTDFLDPSSIRYSNETIGDYEQTISGFRTFHEDRNHRQIGDPEKLADVILNLARHENPPVSFAAGSDAVEWAKSAVSCGQNTLETWHDLSVSTDGAW